MTLPPLWLLALLLLKCGVSGVAAGVYAFLRVSAPPPLRQQQPPLLSPQQLSGTPSRGPLGPCDWRTPSRGPPENHCFLEGGPCWYLQGASLQHGELVHSPGSVCRGAECSGSPLLPLTVRGLPQQRDQQQHRHPQRLSGMQMVSVRRYRTQQGPWPLTTVTAASAIVRRNNKKRQLVADYAPLRRLYLQRRKDSKTLDERMHWHLMLQQLPKDSSPTRYRRRCNSTGRARGVYRHFGLCRHKIKEMIDNMEIPGWTKAEW
ncbi:ribosomal protein [Cyclospora cayetanensis]|uniref:Ribosomal protein n=1 Tax=Cyclospora cayetanensis TaxID=88456 RepID=A0A1D3CTC8_9EIME|nr:ribosomal protein [Cyclospora cayetanensis]